MAVNDGRSEVIAKLRRFYPPAASKKCLECERDRPLEAFRKDGRRADGRVTICRSCRRALRAALLEKWRATHAKRGA
jgi:hypothetical protein